MKKDRRNNPGGLAALDIEYLKVEENKIELVSCHLNNTKCESLIAFINENYVEATKRQIDKDYAFAIGAFEKAYRKTFVLTDQPCLNCAAYFRSVIMESMENMKKELKKSSSGIFFKRKKLQTSYEICKATIDELKKLNNSKTKQGRNNYEKSITSVVNRVAG